MQQPKEILIVGAGFAGITAALELYKQKDSNTHIRLVSTKPYFEYHGAMYRTVTGRSPLETCLPLWNIFSGTDVDVISDAVRRIDASNHKAIGRSGSAYRYDVLILALGTDPFFPDIPGIKEYTFGFQSERDALRLKRRVHSLFSDSSAPDSARTFAIVGAGASGVEMAGEMALYAKKVAKCHGLSEGSVFVELIEAQERILPTFPEGAARRVEKRLRSIGVKIHLGKRINAIGPKAVTFSSGDEVRTKTVIWTAGLRANRLYKDLVGARVDSIGRVEVDEFFRAKGAENVYVIGDGAAVPDSGMAQAAVAHAKQVARVVGVEGSLEPYHPIKSIYALPVGRGWASVTFGNFSIYGRIGWIVRRLADFKVFLMFLSFGRAWDLFRAGAVKSEECPQCCESSTNYE